MLRCSHCRRVLSWYQLLVVFLLWPFLRDLRHDMRRDRGCHLRCGDARDVIEAIEADEEAA